MKNRQYQFDVAEVTITCCKALVACFTIVPLSRDAHPRVKRAMGIDSSAFVKVEEAPIRYFNLGLVYNVLTRPA